MKLIYRCLCLVLGSILGSGCSDSTDAIEYGPQPEYGVPTGTVHIAGRVIDDQGAPIRGIEVRFNGAGADTSDAVGNWAIDRNHAVIPCVDDAGTDCILEVDDIDGSANGGPYPLIQLVLDLVQTEPGSGTFDLGTWEQSGIEIIMSDALEYGPPVARMPRIPPPPGADR